MTQPGHCNNGPNVSTERQRNRPKACKSLRRSGNENLDRREQKVSKCGSCLQKVSEICQKTVAFKFFDVFC